MIDSPSFAFFGSSQFSVHVLNQLRDEGLIPQIIITTPDKPRGRNLTVSPTVVKIWAEQNHVVCLSPAKLDQPFISEFKTAIAKQNRSVELFVVASYGKIIPAAVIDLPKHRTLNIHPSLLPKYRGASPIQSAMLDDTKRTGVSIMVIDEEMDHGPIVEQMEHTVTEWPTYEELEVTLAKKGATLLAKIIPLWLAAKITSSEQDHAAATYSRKITKEDGLIKLTDNPYVNYRKIQAFHEWPQAYFFANHRGKDIRVKITQATYRDGVLNIERVIPEGKKEMPYTDFQNGYLAK